jgi:acyl-CoA reductase-like NAD-dependent aldehyde dehydrogenase
MKRLEVVNPATGRIFRTLVADSAETVAAKYAAARAAQPGWAARPWSDRLDAVARFRERIAAETDRLAATLTREIGKPIVQSRNELKGFLGRIDFFLQSTEAALRSRTVWNDGGMTEKISHEPLGVVANISAWNYPYYVGGNVFLPALLAGNCVLYKPSEIAPLTGLAIGELLQASGIPADAFIPVIGGAEAGAALLREGIDGVFFTGSHATGKKIAEAVAGRMIKLQLELGGKDPAYVCDDVDLANAAASLADGAFYNTGQSCCSVERIYVHRSIYETFVAAFLAEVKRFKIGSPMSETTYIGPLARRAQIAVLEAQVADARRKGARVLLGGERIPGGGNYFQPTVVAEADNTMALMREESFGPVVGLMPAADDEEAVALMNDTEFGLTAGVYSPNRKRAERILSAVRSGSAYWNCCDRVSPRLPWSGVGHSGVGVTLSTYGIQAFARPRAWHLRQPIR